MSTLSRRQFLKSLGAVATFFVAHRTGFSLAQNGESFEMLVVGDSLVWGQGLEEEHKFYTLTKNWLETELGKTVNLKIKAHSGATIFLHDEESKLLEKGGVSETKTFYPEIALAFPTLKTQIDSAKTEYQNPEDVDLVLLTGGLVDISVPGILNPFGNDQVLKNDIKKYCHDDMLSFLENTAQVFPNALLAVVSYFPIVSKQTDTGKMMNAFLEAYGIPRPLKPLVNNILIRQFFKPIKNKALKRSRIWFEDSSRELETAVTRLNEKFGRQRAVFVKTPLTEAHAFEAKETQLFKMEKGGRANDEFYDERLAKCRPTLTELKESTGFKSSIRQCEVAGIGHPNIEGAKAYAEELKKTLSPLLKTGTKFRQNATLLN
jgi:lysophospholipase L1-like esterase